VRERETHGLFCLIAGHTHTYTHMDSFSLAQPHALEAMHMKALEHCGRQGFVAPPLDRSDFGRLSVTPTDNSMLSPHPFDRSKGDIGSMDFPWGSGKYCILHSDITLILFQ